MKNGSLAKNQAIMHKNFFDKTKEAKDNGFYLEAIFREYAAIEGRLEIMCGVLGLPCNKDLNPDIRKRIGISQRRDCLQKIYDNNNLYGKGDFQKKSFEDLKDWIKDRNTYVHGLYKNAEQYDARSKKAQKLADDGYNIANDLYNEVHRLRRLLKAGKLESFCDDCKRKCSFLKDNEEAGK